MSGIKHGLENELGIRRTGSGLALAALMAGGLLVLWALASGGSTRENCERGDVGACAELHADYR
jgi:hypothetical protein